MLPEPVARLDQLTRRAATTVPDRAAICTDRGGSLTFAELDRRVNGFAAHLAQLAAGRQEVVAVASVLDPAFAVAYYGTVRAGQLVVPVIPLLREEALAHLLATTRARVLVAPAELVGRVAAVKDRLPDLDTVIELDGAPLRTELDWFEAPPRQPHDVACIQFTSGTTGLPKGIRQTHHNLAVNAAQTAVAHELDAASVTVNHLPSYHPMHLNSALHAAATQVLCTDPDPIASVTLANRVRATRYYGLPMRLTRLAEDPRLASVRLETVRAINSGGSALAVPVTQRLSGHFGIPVLQGYGLAEASPMTHCDLRSAPKPGSCGPLVAGAECQIVDLDTRAPLPPGGRGEILVRGPQVMPGYLDEPDGVALDDDGWFATGDVGYVDDDGYLFLVDRLKDVFKCDNWLVSPTELELLLRRHPAVVDCVVLDRPDRFSGAVAVALVVPRGGAEAIAGLAAEVNKDLPYYQHIRQVAAVTEVPRAPNGKVRRRELRQRLDELMPVDVLSGGPAGQRG